MKKKKLWILAAVVLAAAAVGILTATHDRPVEPIVMEAPSQDSPMGPRKIMNYDGHRYAFLENGALYRLEDQVGQELGVLEGDILADPQGAGQKDLAATFALGGKVRVLAGYDPRFRVAVELDGSYYICENVAAVGRDALDLEEYLDAADFDEIAGSAEILDHMGREVLTGTEPGWLLDDLREAEPAVLTDEDYASIGQAQREGKSFRVELLLADGTRYGFYLIPELQLAMVGDSKYTLELSHAEIFDGLEQGPLPMA